MMLGSMLVAWTGDVWVSQRSGAVRSLRWVFKSVYIAML